jgi:hypothetical protein
MNKFEFGIAETAFNNEFVGMSRLPVSCEELMAVRERLIDLLRLSLSMEEKRFLLSVQELEPDWTLLGITGVESLRLLRMKSLRSYGFVLIVFRSLRLAECWIKAGMIFYLQVPK